MGLTVNGADCQYCKAYNASIKANNEDYNEKSLWDTHQNEDTPDKIDNYTSGNSPGIGDKILNTAAYLFVELAMSIGKTIDRATNMMWLK